MTTYEDTGSLESSMLRKMLEIRYMEQTVEKLFMENLIGGTVHLYIGQEAVAVGACSAIDDKDYMVSNHRGHGHFVAKGGDPGRIMAEILGRETGYCRGKGGSMHVSDIDIGNIGANGIVGAGIPIATGAALALKLQKKPQVVLCFFGDGAANTGAFHEGINLAAVYSLPVVFICENNCYAISSSSCDMLTIDDLSERGRGYGMEARTVDGMDVMAVRRAVQDAVRKARQGQGPIFLECKTYRFRGHFIGDPCAYRTSEELEEWKAKDPIETFKAYLLEKEIMTMEAIKALEEEVRLQMEAAEAFAVSSPAPKGEDALDGIYA